jgi:predicted exporter
MSEPISGSAAGVAGWKLIGGMAGAGAIGAGLASLVVMCMMTPRSRKEWAVGLTSTVVGSVCGGAAVVQKFGLQAWTHEYIGIVALLGVVFGCGLPAWAVVRWIFNFIEKHRDESLDDVVADVRKGIGQ